ncbi:MAG: hypothetical protein CM1200mP3_08240 [Chloroflexota bacterium]|nr:MAG: hypothetical protein CM1200mP3_08240 [Chloroflexota bacterium]
MNNAPSRSDIVGGGKIESSTNQRTGWKGEFKT